MKTKFPNYIILILLAIGRVVLGIGCTVAAPKKKHSDVIDKVTVVVILLCIFIGLFALFYFLKWP